MQKAGTLIVNGEIYYISLYTNGIDERLDIISDVKHYNYMSTIDCQASYIFTSQQYIYGDYNLISLYTKIVNEASMLKCEEKQDVEISETTGDIVYVVSKEDPSGSVKFTRKLINGKIAEEEYMTEDGEVLFSEINDKRYNAKDKPINFSDYNSTGVFSKKVSDVKRTSEFYSYEELLAKYPDIMHVAEHDDYVVVENYQQGETLLNTWIASKEQLKSFDIESTGTDWGPTSQCRITGVFLGLGTEWSTYFPFRQDNFDYNLPIEFLRRIFDAINNQPKYPEVIILAHNVKFEIEGFYQEYRDFVRFDIDTYLLAVLADPMVRKGTHTLKALTSKVDNRRYLTLEEIFIGPVKFNVLPPEIVRLYGCPDATSPAKIYPYLMERIPKDEKFVIELEMKLPVIKAMNEFYGINLDQELLDVTLHNAEQDAENLMKKFQKMHKITGNINSPQILRDVIYTQLRCPVKLRTKKGLPATSKSAIEGILKSGVKEIPKDAPMIEDWISVDGHEVLIKGKDLMSNNYPSLVIYQAYKSLQKKIGALRRLKDRSVAGFFKFYINQSGAGSNRQTSDAHQFDDTMKKCAIADSKYHQLVSCDWKQVELRILAGMAKQQDLIELESDPDVDIHRAILSIIQGKPMYLISEEDRKKGKSVNFGVVYGMTEYGLAQRDFGIGYTKENLNEERKKITDFYTGLPQINNFISNNKKFMLEHGYVKTAFNYYRYFPQLKDPECTPKDREKAFKQGGNTPIQGTGAQMLKIVEDNVWHYIRKKGWDKEKDYDGMMLPMVRMIVPIHDEILLSYDKSIPMEEICSMFKECMELDIDGMPPFFAAPAFISNWYQGKDSAYEVDITLRDKIVEEYHKGNYMLTGHDYLTVLNEYRDKSIKEYLDKLILKYKTVDAVAEHVTDNNLTHVIIETLPKEIRKKLTHKERIHQAVQNYMEKVDYSQLKIEYEDDSDEPKYSIDEWIDDEVYEVNQFGDIVEEEKDEEDEYYETSEDLLVPLDFYHVTYTLRECIVDFTGYSDKEFQNVVKLCNDKEFYNLMVLKDGKLVETKYKVGFKDREAIESIFKEA